MTELVNPSQNRAASSFKTAGAIAYGGYGDGYIVDSASPTRIAREDGSIDETQFNAFAQTSSASSFDVTIDPGEAFVGGAWLAKDTTTTVTLASSTNNQTVYLGWNNNGTDDVVIGLNSAFDTSGDNLDARIPIFDFDTDGSGVTSVTDRRDIGWTKANTATFASGLDTQGDITDGSQAIWDESAQEIPDSALGSIDNATLTNSSITVNANDGLKSGGSVSLGGSVGLDIEPTDFAGTFLSDDGSDNLQVNLGRGVENDGTGSIRVDEDTDFTFTADIDLNGGATLGGNLDLSGSSITDTSQGYLDLTGDGNNLRLGTGQTIEDGGGTNRFSMTSAGTDVLSPSGGGRVGIFDFELSGYGVKYQTDASAGVLRTPNAGTRIEAGGTPNSGDGLELLRLDSSRSRIQHRDRDNAVFRTLEFGADLYDFSAGDAPLRLATGQAIEDGSGTARLEILSDRTKILDDAGNRIFGAISNSESYLSVFSGQPLKIRDREGGFVAVQYNTDTSAGVLRTPSAAMRVEANNAPSSGEGLELKYDSGSNRSILTSYSRSNSVFKDVDVNASTIRLTSNSGLIDLSGKSANLRLATGRDIKDDSGRRVFQVNGRYPKVFFNESSGAGRTFEVVDDYTGNKKLQITSSSTELLDNNVNIGQPNETTAGNRIWAGQGRFSHPSSQIQLYDSNSTTNDNFQLNYNGSSFDVTFEDASAGTFTDAIQIATGGQVTLPSGGLDMAGNRIDFVGGGGISSAAKSMPLITQGSGSDNIRIRDEANSQAIVKFIEGTTPIVELTNAKLNTNGNGIRALGSITDFGSGGRIRWADEGGGSKPRVYTNGQGEVVANDDNGNTVTLT